MFDPRQVDPQHVIASADELRSLVPAPRAAQETKVLDALDGHCRRWIEASPFLVLSSVDAHGRMDLSPKGDPPGFVRILDDQHLAIPDRPGNRRLDTMLNVLERPQVLVVEDPHEP
ncbi:MAG: pyridoxamine 5'-phosphate oxidase family protein, partial [Actinomycetota bacterium]